MTQSDNEYLTYEHIDCCPICASKDFTIGSLRHCVVQATPMKAKEIYQQAIVDVIPALCNHCGISFNHKGLSPQARDHIYRNYQFISPASGVGAANYATYINEVKKHLPNKDGRVLDIGGYDGYLVRQLHQDGYKHLTLIDPSAQIFGLDYKKDKIKAITGFFPQDEQVYQKRQSNEQTELYDVIGAKDLLTAIPNLNDFFKGLNYVLKTGGVVVCSNPPLKNITAMQYNHLSYNAHHYLATQYGFELIDTYAKTENSYVVYVLKKVLDLKEASDKQILEFRQIHKLDEKVFNANKIQDIKDMNDTDMLSPMVAKEFSHILSESSEAVIYGTGMYTFHMLDSLDDKYFSLNNNKDKAKLSFVNSSKSNEGYLYMLPDSSTVNVHYAFDYLKDRHIDTLILGVQCQSFKDEILANIKDINCTYNKIVYIPDLEKNCH